MIKIVLGENKKAGLKGNPTNKRKASQPPNKKHGHAMPGAEGDGKGKGKEKGKYKKGKGKGKPCQHCGAHDHSTNECVQPPRQQQAPPNGQQQQQGS